MKTILICGFGYVGQAIYKFFKDHYIVKFYDPAITQRILKNPAERDAYSKLGWTDTHCKADLTVVCVPTEPAEDGSCDISIVEDTLGKLPKENELVLIKSTIAPSTTDRLKDTFKKRIVFSPEYIGEGKYFIPFWKYPDPTNMKLHDFHIFGGDKKDTDAVVQFYLPITGPVPEFCQVTSLEAEVTKYTENIWGAMKVTWANEMFEICKAHGVEWSVVRELWAKDKRVERMHTAVFKNKRGFGGKCFPKDLLAMIKSSKDKGYKPQLLEQIWLSNEKFIKQNDSSTNKPARERDKPASKFSK